MRFEHAHTRARCSLRERNVFLISAEDKQYVFEYAFGARFLNYFILPSSVESFQKRKPWNEIVEGEMKVSRVGKLRRQIDAASKNLKCRDMIERLLSATREQFCPFLASYREWPYEKVRSA